MKVDVDQMKTGIIKSAAKNWGKHIQRQKHSSIFI